MVVLFEPETDATWQGVPSILLTMIETSVYLISACMLQSRPLLQYLLGDNAVTRLRSSASVLMSRPSQSTKTASEHELKDASEVEQRVLKSSSEDNEMLQSRKDEIVITSEFSVSHTYGPLKADRAFDSLRNVAQVQPKEQV